MRFSGLLRLGFYLGVGALLHAWMVGPQFDWSSAWTWGWLFGWPVALVVAFWGVILALVAVSAVVSVGIVVFDSDAVAKWRANRMLRRVAKRVKRPTQR